MACTGSFSSHRIRCGGFNHTVLPQHVLGGYFRYFTAVGRVETSGSLERVILQSVIGFQICRYVDRKTTGSSDTTTHFMSTLPGVVGIPKVPAGTPENSPAALALGTNAKIKFFLFVPALDASGTKTIFHQSPQFQFPAQLNWQHKRPLLCEVRREDARHGQEKGNRFFKYEAMHSDTRSHYLCGAFDGLQSYESEYRNIEY